jgi:hypothetical protein
MSTLLSSPMRDISRFDDIEELTDEQEKNLYRAIKAAWKLEHHLYPFPGRATVAIWAVRSDWGENQQGFNPFGIRRKLREGEYELVAFPTLLDGFLKFNALVATDPAHTPDLIQYWRGGIDTAAFLCTLAKNERDAVQLLAALHHPTVIKLWTRAFRARSAQKTRHSPRNVTP